MIIKVMYSKFRSFLREKLILEKRRNELKRDDITIISSDCTGGLLCKELGMQFKSPTINMFMNSKDFIRFCKDIKYWIDQPMIEVKTTFPYPVAELGKEGVVLHLVHYNSVQEAQKKWDERKKRINYDNICLIMNDRNGCVMSDIYEFEGLPYKKILFVHLPVEKCPSAQYIPGFEKASCVPVMTNYKNKFSIEKNIDMFDFVTWLNE